MEMPDGCEYCADAEICPNIKDDFILNIEPTLRNFDVYIICTPTWDDGVTPLVKIFWDRIVSWSHDDRKYLKDKKLGIITHGMAGKFSWKHPINWVKSVCFWEKSKFAGSLTFSSGAKPGTIEVVEKKLVKFINKIVG